MADINWADFKPAGDQDVPNLVAAITHVESRGDPEAASSQGALGSMQINPATFRQYATPGQDDIDNDAHRSAAAVRKIVDDYVHFKGDLAKTAAAYIGGRGAVRPDGTIRDDVADANGTTPAAYAQMVLDRVQARPKVDWSQFKPVPDAGGGRGFANPPAADPTIELASPAGTAYSPPDVAFDPMGSGGPEIAAALQQPPDAGAGRGSVNPPPAVQPREVGLMESLGRGFGRAGAETARMPALMASAAGVALDKLRSAVTGQTETGAQDWMFRNLVDPRQEAVDWYALGPDEKQGFLGKVADSVGAMVQDLPLMIASGGLKQRQELAQQFPTLLRFLEDSVGQGFEAMRPIMVKAGAEKAKQVLDAGGTTAQAMNSATVAALWTGMSGSQPMSAAGSLPSRIATGIPVGMAQEEAGRVVQNAADPADLQRPFDPAEMAAGGVTNAIAAGAMGHAAAGRVPDRIDLGYEPMTGKTPVAEAVQGMGEPPPRPGPLGAAPARDHVADIFNAGTVEEAALSALKVAEKPGGPSVADEIRSIRPSQPVDLHEAADGSLDERTASEVPAVPAAADGAGGADAGAGVDLRAGGDLVPQLPVEPRGLGAEAAPGAAPVGARERAGAVEEGAPAPAARFEVERTASGSVIVRGDKAAIREALSNLPPDVMVPTKDGIQVAKNWSDKAATLVQDFDPSAYQHLNGRKVSITVEAEDGTRATLKLDAGRGLRAVDARERELERLRGCVERAS